MKKQTTAAAALGTRVSPTSDQAGRTSSTPPSSRIDSSSVHYLPFSTIKDSDY